MARFFDIKTKYISKWIFNWMIWHLLYEVDIWLEILLSIVFLKIPILMFSFLVFHIVEIYKYRNILQIFFWVTLQYFWSKYKNLIFDVGLKLHTFDKILSNNKNTGFTYAHSYRICNGVWSYFPVQFWQWLVPLRPIINWQPLIYCEAYMQMFKKYFLFICVKNYAIKIFPYFLPVKYWVLYLS